MSPEPLFSIIIPTLGKIDQWEQAILSIVAQEYTNWEVIAIDSGPAEKSRHIIDTISDSRIKYVNTASQDPRLNWDVGFRNSTGKYLLWLDDDNYLLDNALSALSNAVVSMQYPDIISGEHMHYRGKEHYIKDYRNQLVIPLPVFTGGIKRIDPQDIVRRLLGWPQKDTSVRARFHTSENAVKKTVVEDLISKIGEINFKTTSTHSLRLGIIALSKTIYTIDVPIALIGQSGHAMTDTWPHISSPVLKEFTFQAELSPFSAQAYANYRMENLLRTKKALGNSLATIDLNMTVFLKAYVRELIVLDQAWTTWWKNWSEIRGSSLAVDTLGLQKIVAYQTASLFLKILKALGLYRPFQLFFKKKRVSQKNQLVIPLDSFGVLDIKSCAEKLPNIIKKELKIDYQNFIFKTLENK